MSSIRVVFSSSQSLYIEQLDVKIAFLHRNLWEEIYMEQHKGFKLKAKKILFLG